MSYRKRRNYIAQQRAKARSNLMRVSHSRSKTAALAIEGAMYFLMGLLFAYALWSVLWT